MLKISVVMPAYNVEQYVVEAINSILNQSLCDFELIIINDGSTDKTRELIEQFNDSRIVLVNNQKNLGLVKSLNLAFNLARGKYIARMDSDDFSEPERFMLQYMYCEEYRLDLCGAHWLTICEKGIPKSISFAPRLLNDLVISLANGSPFAHGSVMLRRDFLVNKKLSYKDKYAEDYTLWLEMYDLGAKIGAVDKILYRYRAFSTSWSNLNFIGYKKESYKLRSNFIKTKTSTIVKVINEFINKPVFFAEKSKAGAVYVGFFIISQIGFKSYFSLLRKVGLIATLIGVRRILLHFYSLINTK